MITVGVVIDVPEPHGETISAACRAWPDFDPGGVPPHITIVAPVSVDAEVLPAVEAHVAQACAATAPFAMTLRGTGTFRPASPVVFLAVAEGISQCEALEQLVRCGPLAVDLRFPYHPHVTVAAEVADQTLDRAFADLADFRARFVIDRVSLYEWDEAGWRIRRRLPLTGGSAR